MSQRQKFFSFFIIAAVIAIILFWIAASPFFQIKEKDPHTREAGPSTVSPTSSLTPVALETPSVVLPMIEYDPSYKRFGEYVSDRFVGYHAGEDSEGIAEGFDIEDITPVYAIADGTLVYKNWVKGYGGVTMLEHVIDNEKIRAIYGHLNIDSVPFSLGDRISQGSAIGNLGQHKSEETDGEREHLHFALYRGDDIRLQGYEKDSDRLLNWINPYDFFVSHGILFEADTDTRLYSTLVDPSGKKLFHLDFAIPGNWDVEYIPSLKALNLYTVSGPGAARSRSQMLIRFFDASTFLTLNTVIIHNTEDTAVGEAQYTARRYDIEKKPGVPDFSDQPAWRNQRHIVTDFRAKEGLTRYYVVAANPALNPAVYKEVLASMRIEN